MILTTVVAVVVRSIDKSGYLVDQHGDTIVFECDVMLKFSLTPVFRSNQQHQHHQSTTLGSMHVAVICRNDTSNVVHTPKCDFKLEHGPTIKV